jgi:hypothetical protein
MPVDGADKHLLGWFKFLLSSQGASFEANDYNEDSTERHERTQPQSIFETGNVCGLGLRLQLHCHTGRVCCSAA